MLDKKTILGIGIGFVISAVLLMSMPQNKISKSEIEKMARGMGMVYPNEIKALYDDKK